MGLNPMFPILSNNLSFLTYIGNFFCRRKFHRPTAFCKGILRKSQVLVWVDHPCNLLHTTLLNKFCKYISAQKRSWVWIPTECMLLSSVPLFGKPWMGFNRIANKFLHISVFFILTLLQKPRSQGFFSYLKEKALGTRLFCHECCL